MMKIEIDVLKEFLKDMNIDAEVFTCENEIEIVTDNDTYLIAKEEEENKYE